MPRRVPNKAESTQRRLALWIKRSHTAEIMRQAQILPLRQDMVTLLRYVRDHKVVGTQSTGNLPLKVVREVTARFVNPPQLDTTIGDHVYRLRSEEDIWSLHYLHILAEVGGLVAVAPARRWRLTPQGEKFLETDPLLQVSYLLSIWWYQVNWLVAYPFTGMGEALPPDFNRVTLAQLRSLPVGKSIAFEKFADRLIKKAGLTWTAKVDSAPMSLRGSIQQMVINILAKFGGVTREYREDPLGKGTISKLDTFEITPFGKALLEAAAIVSR